MVQIGFYLHKDIYQYVRKYGSVEEVVNKLLDLSDTADLDVYNKPTCPRVTKECVRCNIDIKNENYLSMRSVVGHNNPMISIRRMLYWFANQDIGKELGWIAKEIEQKTTKLEKFFDNAEITLKEIFVKIEDETTENKVKEAIKLLREIRHELQHNRVDQV